MERSNGWGRTGWVTALTALALGVHGYHPYAEDGGLYLAEIKRMLDPGLYPVGGEFVSGHLGVPVFSGGVAWVVRASGVGLPWVMFGLYVGCVWGLLWGMGRLAALCYEDEAARWGAVGLLAVWLTLPVAGTSLLMVDPYVTARSLSTVLTLVGMELVVEWFWVGGWRLWGAVGVLGAAVAVHPLMGGYGVVEAGLLGMALAEARARWWGAAAGVALVGAGVAQRFGRVDGVEAAAAVASRTYWFLGNWRWFEWLGLVGPLAILAWVGWKSEARAERGMARMGLAAGVISLLVAGVFARVGGEVHAVARMQPLRCFLMVYLVMVMALGARLGQRVLGRSRVRWAGALVVLGGVMLAAERGTYPASDRWEMPGTASRNEWEQAFVWIKGNTPRDAVFALDADYVKMTGEDAQGFRAVAERSALADYSKDGGQTSIRPDLAGAWMRGQKAQAGLSAESDAERVRALAGTGATWVVLAAGVRTGFACPYANGRVRVCLVPESRVGVLYQRSPRPYAGHARAWYGSSEPDGTGRMAIERLSLSRARPAMRFLRERACQTHIAHLENVSRQRISEPFRAPKKRCLGPPDDPKRSSLLAHLQDCLWLPQETEGHYVQDHRTALPPQTWDLKRYVC